MRYYFKDIRGFAYDEVNACMAASVGWSNLVDLEARLERIRGLRATPDFEPLAASFKRIRTFWTRPKAQASPSGLSSIDEALLEAGPERELYARVPRHPGAAHRKRDLAPASQSRSLL